LVDDGLNILIFAALGIGVYRSGASPWFLAGGIVASLSHVFYDAVALTEIKRQGEGGEIIKVHWRLAGKDNMKTRLSRGGGKLSPSIMLYSLGRRDFYVLAFLVYALLGASKLAVIHALLIAVPLALMAGVQVIWRLRGSPK
jgi:hypothetical protein